MPRPLPPDDVFRRLAALRDRLHADPAAAPRQAEMARQAGLSQFHFLRRYKEAFGVTPHQDLTRLRIDRAKALLAAEVASVTEVCFEVGFSSLGSFSALFAERAGCPPSAWRRRFWQVAGLPQGRARMRVPWCFVVHFAGADVVDAATLL
ncbi:helix-turn-helix domain-containing protein [Nannocystis punicea]|uniref:AraC family transcriptional regulator n=1 Tax=Nannocystis punicea TaxID=2995304 RepID=A0ABY7H7T6_9BACT|nr:AraC family transcriptional regulator [Nannocystis poenicansa]WAS95339.1 AraC family transcriptional regulator [Nannocystis poenicansa]